MSVYQFTPGTSILRQFVTFFFFDNSPTDSSSSFLNWWSSKQGVETLCSCSVFVHQFAISLNAFLNMSFHVVGPRKPFLREVFLTLVIFQMLQQKQVIQTILCIPQWWFRSVCIQVEYIPNKHVRETMLVLQDRRPSSIPSTWTHFWSHPCILIRITLVFDEQTGIPNSELSPIQVPSKLSQTVFPTRGLQVGVRINFVQEEPLDLQCLATIWAIYVVGDVSIYLWTCWLLDLRAIWERPPFVLGCKRMLRRLLVLHNQVVLQWHSSLLLLSFVMLKILVH